MRILATPGGLEPPTNSLEGIWRFLRFASIFNPSCKFRSPDTPRKYPKNGQELQPLTKVNGMAGLTPAGLD